MGNNGPMSSPDGPGTQTPVSDAPPPGDHDGGAPAASKRDIKPSVAWYWVGALILVLGTVGAFVLMIVGIVTFADAPNHYERISVPGERAVAISEPGTYHLYGETGDYYSSTNYGSSYYSYNTIVRPTVTVTDANGTSIPVTAGPETSVTSYSANGLSAYDFASFYVPSAGTYTVTVKEPALPARTSTRSGNSTYVETYDVTRVAVGNSVASTAVPELVSAAALGSIGVLLGLFILIMTAVKRNRSRNILFPPRPRPAPYGSYGPVYAPAGAGYRPGPGYGPGGYPPPGYPPPGYPPPGYPPRGYPPPGYPPPGYPPPGYQPPGGPGGPPYSSAPGGAPSGPPAGSPVASPFGAASLSASPFDPAHASGSPFAPPISDAPREESAAPGPIRDLEPPVADVPDYLEPPTSTAPAAHPVVDHVVTDDAEDPSDDADD